MLSVELSDQQSLRDFVKDKTDREVGLAALTIIDTHLKECAERQDHVMKILKWIGSAVGCLILERVANDVHWQFLKPLIGAIIGG
jgi:hypothetical protein